MNYQAPNRLFKNPYVQAFYARFFRHINQIKYARKVLDTPDGDLLDLDFSSIGSSKLVILCHGLESFSTQRHVLGVVSALNDSNFDVAVMNYRSCCNKPSKKHFLVELGETEDLQVAVDFAASQKTYEQIYLLGYSSGGNYVLKYLGEQADTINPLIKKACAVSPASHMASTVERIQSPENYWCLRGFLFSLFRSLLRDGEKVSNPPRWQDFFKVKDFEDFYYRFLQEHYLLSFPDFLEDVSSDKLLTSIKIPVQILVAHDDPFLDMGKFPFAKARSNPLISLIETDHGGHVGFVDFTHQYFWSERVAIEFFQPC